MGRNEHANRPVTWGRALTLIELAAVVSIIFVLAMVAAPRMANSIAVRSAETAGQRICKDLEHIRTLATTTSTPQTFRLVTGTDPGYMLVGVKSLKLSSQTYTVSFARDCSGITLASYDLGGDLDLVFDIFGVPDSAGQLVISRGGQQRTITIDSATGQLTLTP